MSAHRHEPPELAGLTYLDHLGSGGYADVYLYEQAYPRRKVAVKVLHADSLSADAEREVQAEANEMAELHHHPHIVQVLDAGTAPDGRPYIVMRYYPGPNFARRAATERLSVAETLQVGVQLASAVETAHRAGIFHRDIKPANVLTDEYGGPALTDFGISARAEQTTQDAGAMSLPWAPPEIVFGSGAADARADVYSLAATLWHLLVGRAPFDEAGGDNRPTMVMGRIRSTPPPATGRGDVPASLERVLQNAMAKVPATRPATALEFGRALQAVEQEQRLPQTRLALIDTQRESRSSTKQPVDATRAKPMQRVSLKPPSPPPDETARRPTQPTGPAGLIASVPDSAGAATPPALDGLAQRAGPTHQRAQRAAAKSPLPDTDVRPQRVQPADDAPDEIEQSSGRSRKLFYAAIALLILIGGGVALAASLGGSGKPSPAGRQTVGDAGPQDVVVVGVPGTPQVRSSRSGRRVVFQWGGYDGALTSDMYRWRQTLNGKTTTGATGARSRLIVAPGRGTLCLTVQVLRADGSEPSAFSSPACVHIAASTTHTTVRTENVVFHPAPPSVHAIANGTMITYRWSGGRGGSIAEYQISLDGGAWQNEGRRAGSVGLHYGYGETHQIVARIIDSSGHVSRNSNTAAARTADQPPAVRVVKGGPYVGPGCGQGPCSYVQVTLSHFAAGAHTVVCHDSYPDNGGAYYTYTTTNTMSSVCFYGYDGDVWVTVDGIESNHLKPS